MKRPHREQSSRFRGGVRHLWELPFAMQSADVVHGLTDEQGHARVFASWGSQAPRMDTDQYILWSRDVFVQRFYSTARAIAPFTVSGVDYEDYRTFEGFLLPGRVTVRGDTPEGRTVQQWRLRGVRFGPVMAAARRSLISCVSGYTVTLRWVALPRARNGRMIMHLRVLTLTLTLALSAIGCTADSVDEPDAGAAVDLVVADTSNGMSGHGSSDAALPDVVTGELLAASNGRCVPEGQQFTEVYSCEYVRAPTGNAELPSTSKVTDPSPERLDDPDRAWVEAQLAACSCICCHGTVDAPPTGPNGRGRYVWDSGFLPIWSDSATDDILRGVAGLRGDTTQTNISASDNHGFARFAGSVPTTDHDRLAAYVEREIARRSQ